MAEITKNGFAELPAQTQEARFDGFFGGACFLRQFARALACKILGFHEGAIRRIESSEAMIEQLEESGIAVIFLR